MDIFRSHSTTSPQETARLGQELGSYIVKSQKYLAWPPGQAKVKSEQDRGALTVCLYGEMGSGKTTFVQGFAKALGITARLLSPTFFIVRRYLIPHSVGYFYHIDLYRVMGEKELVELGLPEMLADPDSIVLIEWAEKLGSLLPQGHLDIHFFLRENGSHEIVINEVTK